MLSSVFWFIQYPLLYQFAFSKQLYKVPTIFFSARQCNSCYVDQKMCKTFVTVYYIYVHFWPQIGVILSTNGHLFAHTKTYKWLHTLLLHFQCFHKKNFNLPKQLSGIFEPFLNFKG